MPYATRRDIIMDIMLPAITGDRRMSWLLAQLVLILASDALYLGAVTVFAYFLANLCALPVFARRGAGCLAQRQGRRKGVF